PTLEAIVAAPYLEAGCNECLRLYPVVNDIARRPRRPLTVLGVALPAGVMVGPSVLMGHRRGELYPGALGFRPERCLGRRSSLYEFLPFGGGQRRCIGAAFALYEMKVVLATLLRARRFERIDRRANQTGIQGITFGPARPVRLRVK